MWLLLHLAFACRLISMCNFLISIPQVRSSLTPLRVKQRDSWKGEDFSCKKEISSFFIICKWNRTWMFLYLITELRCMKSVNSEEHGHMPFSQTLKETSRKRESSYRIFGFCLFVFFCFSGFFFSF